MTDSRRRDKGPEFWSWYDLYLRSPEWDRKRRQVLRRARGICERCGRQLATEIHHLTYERVGHERLEDLLGLCPDCHVVCHPREERETP